MRDTPGHLLEADGLPLFADGPLRLGVSRLRILMQLLGPSLGLWRAAEIAALREIDFPSPVVDVGCGDGLVGSLALWLVDIGLDPRTDQLKRAEAPGMYKRLMSARIEEADLPDGFASSVVCNSVLEHCSSLSTVLAGIHQVLRPGGLFVFTCPTRLFSRWLALPVPRYAMWRNERLEHMNLLSAEEWMDHLDNSGFTVIKVRYYLRRSLVLVWDLLELLQLVRIRRKAVFSRAWKASPEALIHVIALMASRLDFSSPVPGGGQLIAAVKRQ